MTFGSIKSGLKLVASAGTAVPLAPNETIAQRVTINAKSTNTGKIAVGGSDVVAAIGATQTGVILSANDVYELDINDLNNVYIDSTVNGEGVTFAYFG